MPTIFCARVANRLLLGTMALISAGGCAARAADEARAAELERTVEKLRAQNAAYARQSEELENRVFILTDQAESRKVNAERMAAPALPTLVLRPGAPGATAAEPAAAPSFPGDANVEYAGEAARIGTRRPMLRLQGGKTSLSLTSDAPTIPLMASTETVGPAPPPLASALVSEGPHALYRQALAELRSGQHERAVAGFRRFVTQYPSHDFADNAQYWLGECFYDRKDYGAALREFRLVVERFPQGNKAPDALLKVGFSYLLVGNAQAGRQALGELVKAYPHHESAGLAAAKLSELGVPAAANRTEEIP